jgi:hypothetical protein
MKYKLKFSLHDLFASFISLGVVFIFIVISIISIPKSNSEDYAVIRYNNKIIKKMPLSIDDDFIMLKKDYPDLYGDELIVTVKNQKVSITKEDSPFHYCSYLGEISNRGSSLICAPNCVRVTIEGEGNDNIIDNSDIDVIA